MTRWQRAAGIALVLGASASATIVLLVWPRLFRGTPSGVAKLVAARCAADDAACTAEVIEISRGRYWVEASSPLARGLTLDFEPASPSDGSAAVLLLGAAASPLSATVLCGDGRVDRQEVGGGPRHRRLVRLETGAPACRLRVVVQRELAAPGGAAERLRLEEVGLFTSERGLLEDRRGFLPSQPDRRVYHGILARVCLGLALIGVLAAIFVPTDPARSIVPTFAFCLALAAGSLELWLYYNPYFHGSRDLPVALASGPLQEGVGSNLNYGMYLGSRLLSGEGLTFGPGWVSWDRMPGYAFFCAAAGLLAGYKTDLLTIGLYSIRLHILFSAAAAALFVAAASRVMRPPVALAVAAVITFMPNQLANTQVDSIMVGVYLLTAAALCLYLDKSRGGAMPPPRYHLLVHLAFATWFLMRPDGVVGWMVISLVIYWRAWRYLAIPVAFFLAIGLSWGAYKYRHTGEFSMTTNSVGENAWIGLWQVPNKFRWRTADASYFQYAEARGVPPTSKRANDLTVRDVVRFAATYPVYVAHLMLHKFLDFVDVNVFNVALRYPHVVYERLRGGRIFALMGVVLLCLVLGHEARRTLFLAWPLLFNLPLFLIVFSDIMRHLAPATAALLAAALPPLLEPAFYRRVWDRRRSATALVVALLVVFHIAHWVDDALLASDRWRYWTPLLDPAPFAWYLP